MRDAGCEAVSVGLYFLMWNNRKQGIPHPPKVAEFIHLFDNRRPVSPFSFTLPEPDA